MSMSGSNRTPPPCSPSTPNNSDPLDADSDTAPSPKPRKTFARFLVVEGLDPNKSLTRLNRTILAKTIEGVTSKTVHREWMGRALLVEVNHEAYSTNLLKLTKIGDMPVRVSAHRSLNFCKGVVRFKQAATGLTNEDLVRDLNMSRRNRDSPQVTEARRVIINKDGKKVPTGTFFLTFDAPALQSHIFLGFERFDVELYIPAPRRCFKCQQFGHGARTCRAAEAVCPMCSRTDHTLNECPNKESRKCPNCEGAHSAASRECPVFITEKEALRIQAETRCPLPEARKQAGQPTTAEEATHSYAQVANSQAALVNRNLALSDENARLREVINTLRQDNASLQQRLESCEHRLQTLEKAMVGGAHRDTTVDGVQNTTTEDGVNNTSVGNAHNSISVGSAHNSTPVGDAHNPTSVGDAPTSSVSTANMASQTEHGNISGPYASVSPQLQKAKRPTDAPSYIYRQSPNPKKKVELNRKGPSSIPVTSPITKPAELRNHRKITTKQTRT